MKEVTPDPQDALDDILYFEKKLLTAFAEKDWDKVIIAAKRLKQMDDALIIYRLNRSKERNIKTFDVSNLSPQEAESKIKEIMKKFKGKTDD
jgi:hypothetical protein